MRTFTFALLAAVALPLLTLAQQADNDIRCHSAEHYKQLLLNDPAMAARAVQQEQDIQAWIKKHGKDATRNVVTIPVVVHLTYNPSVNKIVSDWQVQSQIDVMNEDYRRLNADVYKTPDIFVPIAADCEIQFCLAKRDPNGNPTTGIVRNIVTKSDWDESEFNTLKSDAWPKDDYLNLYVANLNTGLLGLTTFPSDPTPFDGCIIADRAFGRIGDLSPKYNMGRTGTHEAGHWLDLYHVWGDDNGACSGTDYCGDTPNQSDYTTGCPDYPHKTCSDTSDMFMNYLDYTRDSCMNIFTHSQLLRMEAALNGPRSSILSSHGCDLPTPYDYDLAVTSVQYPAGIVSCREIHPVVRVKNLGTQTVTSFTLSYNFYDRRNFEFSTVNQFDWTGTLATGDEADLTLPQMRDSVGYNFFIAYAKNINGGMAEPDTVNNYITRSFYVPDSACNNVPGNNVKVYGNPFSGGFRVVFDTLVSKDFNIAVFNTLGQLQNINVDDQSYGLNNLWIDVPNAAPGFYMLRVFNRNKYYGKKLIKLPQQ